MSEWIKCSERMPKPHTDVLVREDGGRMSVRYFEPDDGVHAWGWYPGGRRISATTHWMPLPEPPEAP